MTEEEWRELRASGRLHEFFAARGSERKSRLFAYACIRHCWVDLSPHEVGFLNAGEAVADDEKKWRAIPSRAPWRRRDGQRDAWGSRVESFESARDDWPHSGAARTSKWVEVEGAASCPKEYAILWYDSGDYHRRREFLVKQHWLLVECLFGEAFRPVACDPAWRSSDVVALAEAIYAERAFDRLPILADALEEAGCDHPDVLAHCRGPGPHARGCWVVDLLLGKE